MARARTVKNLERTFLVLLPSLQGTYSHSRNLLWSHIWVRINKRTLEHRPRFVLACVER